MKQSDVGTAVHGRCRVTLRSAAGIVLATLNSLHLNHEATIKTPQPRSQRSAASMRQSSCLRSTSQTIIIRLRFNAARPSHRRKALRCVVSNSPFGIATSWVLDRLSANGMCHLLCASGFRSVKCKYRAFSVWYAWCPKRRIPLNLVGALLAGKRLLI